MQAPPTHAIGVCLQCPFFSTQPLSSLRRAGNRASRPGHRALARSSLLRDWFPCAGAVPFPSGCLAAQNKRWAEGIRVPAPLAGRGSTTARWILRLCPASACQTGLPWPRSLVILRRPLPNHSHGECSGERLRRAAQRHESNICKRERAQNSSCNRLNARPPAAIPSQAGEWSGDPSWAGVGERGASSLPGRER